MEEAQPSITDTDSAMRIVSPKPSFPSVGASMGFGASPLASSAMSGPMTGGRSPLVRMGRCWKVEPPARPMPSPTCCVSSGVSPPSHRADTAPEPPQRPGAELLGRRLADDTYPS